jgi:zinc carboxypeptidase/immune inhibitor InhA-like protein
MRRGSFLCALIIALVTASTALGAGNKHLYEVYTAKVSRDQAREITRAGYDVAAIRGTAAGVQLDLVLSGAERSRLAGQGIDLSLKRLKNGLTIQEFAARQSAFGFNVWRSFDEPGGIRDELYDIARRNSKIVKLEVIGRSIQGREIIALKVTKDARTLADGARPAALNISLQHAREWISVEVNRRLLHHFVDNYGRNAEVTNLVNTRELWFVIVANPDGYEFTFTDERLWRKNLRDNDSNGEITVGDGVDPNRNWPNHWGWDDEGSATLVSDETYRGSAPASEPETRAMKGLFDRLKPKFMINWHSAAQQLLASFGWQESQPAADNPISIALSGTDANPAIPGFDVGLSSDELYITNGDTNDYAQGTVGIISWVPELSEGCVGCGFVFPDDEALVEEEFQRNFRFALNVARSTTNPSNPVSHMGITLEPFYTHQDQLDPQMSNMPLTDFRFNVSYGDPQPVRVLAKRSLGAVSLQYQINGGAVQTKPTSEWAGGDRWGNEGDVYYHIVQGVVSGASPGASVKVWFKDADGPATSEPFTYTLASDTGRSVLILAAEDYTGISPVYKSNPRPAYLQYYLDSLRAIGIEPDVYNVDARGRKAPSHIGVLGHYRAIVWYTGDDVLTREPGMVPGTASRLAQDLMLNVRSYLNEGGRLLYTGKYAGFGNAFGYEFDPLFNRPCDGVPFNREFGADQEGCRELFDDFLQYYLGAYIYADEGGTTPKGTLYGVTGTDNPFNFMTWSFGSPSANNQDHSASFLPTSTFLPAARFPQFQSWRSGRWIKVGGPFEPHTGEYYLHSRIADVSYKRVTRTITVPAGGAELSFWTSYDTEPAWDFLFVEAHAVGSDQWTTLPDLNGHTSTSTGDSCPEGWQELHPWLERYQGADCSGTGTTGTWNAASGTSSGWQQWRVSLAAYAGKQVELHISYASDWAVQGLGVFLDDIAVSTGEGTTSFETDASPMDGWAVTGPAPGSGPNANNFERITAAGFPEAAVVTSQPADGARYRTLYTGFGFEGISTPQARNAFMGRAMQYLLSP